MCEISLITNLATEEGNDLNESWTLNKRWNWSSCIKLALSASWNHGLRAQSVGAFKRNSLVVTLNPTQASNLTSLYYLFILYIPNIYIYIYILYYIYIYIFGIHHLFSVHVSFRPLYSSVATVLWTKSCTGNHVSGRNN